MPLHLETMVGRHSKPPFPEWLAEPSPEPESKPPGPVEQVPSSFYSSFIFTEGFFHFVHHRANQHNAHHQYPFSCSFVASSIVTKGSDFSATFVGVDSSGTTCPPAGFREDTEGVGLTPFIDRLYSQG
jgi:hypothetical protein